LSLAFCVGFVVDDVWCWIGTELVLVGSVFARVAKTLGDGVLWWLRVFGVLVQFDDSTFWFFLCMLLVVVLIVFFLLILLVVIW
jgi:hypothetical protein